MKKITKKEIRNLLLSLKIKNGMNLFVQSDLGELGIIEGGIKELLNSLISVVGPKSTLVFPSYTFNVKHFDIYKTIPDIEIGSFSRYLFVNKIGTRTMHPIHSHIVIGAKEREYTSQISNFSFGQKSLFNEMDKHNFYWLNIGTSIDITSTYFHHIEALVGVPYREWIELSLKTTDQMQKTKNFTAKYYSRILESQNVYNFKKIYDTLISKEIIIKNNNFEIAKFDKVKFETVYQLNNDPNLFKC